MKDQCIFSDDLNLYFPKDSNALQCAYLSSITCIHLWYILFHSKCILSFDIYLMCTHVYMQSQSEK